MDDLNDFDHEAYGSDVDTISPPHSEDEGYGQSLDEDDFDSSDGGQEEDECSDNRSPQFNDELQDIKEKRKNGIPEADEDEGGNPK